MARDDFGGATYREGALDRVGEAFILLESEHFAGSVYLAGRGVESMLRALIWKNDPDIQQGKKSLPTGHDLRKLLTLISNLGLRRKGERDEELQSNVQKVGRLWFNNLRFMSSKSVERWWREIGEVNSSRSLKKASREYYDACSAIIKRCEVLWQR
jgi:HEPN domain-containing protein